MISYICSTCLRIHDSQEYKIDNIFLCCQQCDSLYKSNKKNTTNSHDKTCQQVHIFELIPDQIRKCEGCVNLCYQNLNITSEKLYCSKCSNGNSLCDCVEILGDQYVTKCQKCNKYFLGKGEVCNICSSNKDANIIDIHYKSDLDKHFLEKYNFTFNVGNRNNIPYFNVNYKTLPSWLNVKDIVSMMNSIINDHTNKIKHEAQNTVMDISMLEKDIDAAAKKIKSQFIVARINAMLDKVTKYEILADFKRFINTKNTIDSLYNYAKKSPTTNIIFDIAMSALFYNHGKNDFIFTTIYDILSSRKCKLAIEVTGYSQIVIALHETQKIHIGDNSHEQLPYTSLYNTLKKGYVSLTKIISV